MKLFSPKRRRTLLFFSLAAAVSGALWFAGSCRKPDPPAASPAAKRLRGAHPDVHEARLAIILDDVAGDPAALDGIFALHFPLTLSILPNHPDSRTAAEQAHRRGYEVMLHLPMESEANKAPEPEQLRPGMNARQMGSALDAMLQTVPYAAGVNNHQGSLVTSDPGLMQELMPLLRERNLFFIDSRTTAATVAYETAQHDQVRSAFRNVPFLDDVQNQAAVRRQLQKAIQGAREKGQAIVIGHPHPETLGALREILPELGREGVQLVPVSQLVH